MSLEKKVTLLNKIKRRLREMDKDILKPIFHTVHKFLYFSNIYHLSFQVLESCVRHLFSTNEVLQEQILIVLYEVHQHHEDLFSNENYHFLLNKIFSSLQHSHALVI